MKTILRGYVPFGPIHGINLISMHAIDRATQRWGLVDTFGARLHWIEQKFKGALEITLPPQFRVAKLLDHGLREARYFAFAKIGREKSIVFVVEGEAIKTIHSGAAKEFQQAVAQS